MLVVLIICVASASARYCPVHPVDRDNMLRLRLGQSPDEVEALVASGVCRAAARRVRRRQPSTKMETIWLYATEPGTFVNDEFTIGSSNRTVRASAYRRYSTGWAKRISDAHHPDAHHDPKPDLGPAFEAVFTCRPIQRE